MDAENNRYRQNLLKLKALRDRSRLRTASHFNSTAADAYEHGRYLYNNEQVEEASELFQKLTLQHPMWEDPWLALGISEFRLRRFDRAYTSLSVCWMLHPHNPLPLYHLALVCLQKNRLREARGLFQQVLVIASRDPNHFEVEERAAQQLKRFAHE